MKFFIGLIVVCVVVCASAYPQYGGGYGRQHGGGHRPHRPHGGQYGGGQQYGGGNFGGPQYGGNYGGQPSFGGSGTKKW